MTSNNDVTEVVIMGVSKVGERFPSYLAWRLMHTDIYYNMRSGFTTGVSSGA